MTLRTITLGLCLLTLSATGSALLAPRPVAADPAPAAAQTITLRYKFEPGQVVAYDVTMNDDYIIKANQVVDKPYSHHQSRKHYRVTSVNPDGSAVLELMFDWIQATISQNGQTFTYDSRQKEDVNLQPVFLAMGNLVRKPHLQVTMSPRGEVSSITPLIEIKQMPSDPKQVASDVLLKLPEEPLAIGGSWKEDAVIQIPLQGSDRLTKAVKVQRRYTLKGVQNQLATIDMQSKVLTVLEDPEEQMQILRRTPQGSLLIDLRRGLLVSKEFTQDNEVTGFQTPMSITFKQRHTETLCPDQTAAVPAAGTR